MSTQTQTISNEVVKNMLVRAKADIKLITIPYLEKISSKVKDFKSEDSKYVLDTITHELNVRVKSEEFTNLLLKTIKNAYKLIDFIIEQSTEVLEENMYVNSLTAKQITVIRSSTYFYELTDRIMDLFEYLIICEISTVKDQERYDYYDSNYFKNKLNSAMRFVTRFINTFDSVSIKDFEKMIDEVPEVVVNKDNSNAMVSLYGQNKLFPINLESHVAKEGYISDTVIKLVIGATSLVFKPFMWVISLWSTYSVSRYKQALERKKALDLYLLELETITKGETNPKLEKEINYVQKRVQDLEYEIRDFEESVA